MDISDLGEVDDDDTPYEPYSNPILQARDLYKAGYKLYIKVGNPYIYVCTKRIIGMTTIWQGQFKVTVEEATEIINMGYAQY